MKKPTYATGTAAGDGYPSQDHEWLSVKELEKRDGRIAELEAEVERLRTALSDIVVDAVDMGHYYDVRYGSIENARAVLDGRVEAGE